MRRTAILFWTCLLLPLLSASGRNPSGTVPAETSYGLDSGLAFRSYEVPVEERTAVTLGNRKGLIPFRDSLTMAFSLHIDPDKDSFGSICRVSCDGKLNLNLVLIHDRDVPPGIVANIGSNLSVPIPLEASLDEVNHFRVTLRQDGDSLRVFVNGALLQTSPSSIRFHKARIGFGAAFQNMEVAPLVLHDLSLSYGGPLRRIARWSFGNADLFARSAARNKALILSVTNPLWEEEQASRWLPVQTFPVAYPFRVVFGDPSPGITFASSKEIVRILPGGKEARRFPVLNPLPIEAMGDEFFQESDGSLFLLDLDAKQPEPNHYDFENQCWERTENRASYSRCYEALLFRNPVDDRLVRLFGYGYHQFLNEKLSWKPGEPVSRELLEGVDPRRRVAVCVQDTLAYLFGGNGNASGRQDRPIQDYPEILALNLKDDSVHPVVKLTALSVTSPDLLWKDGLFYTLINDAEKISLIGVDPETGSYRKSPGIRKGMAIYWGCRLLNDGHAWYAYVAGVAKDGEGYVSVFSIRSPFREETPPLPEKSSWPWIMLLVAGVSALSAVWIIRSRRVKPLLPPEQETEPAPKRSQIHLLGFFKVTDPEGQDLTGEFSPMMQQVLTFLLVHCREGKRVSNAQLRENFWFDKSEESFINNRAVYFNRLRTQLEALGAASITNHTGNWSIDLADVACDYYRACQLAGLVKSGTITSAELGEFIQLAGAGPLLPDMSAEWLDRFKAEYTEKMMSALNSLSQQRLSPADRILLSDLIFQFDSTDEEAVRMKCQALMESKRYGAAQECYKAFVQRYQQLMGEAFQTAFSDFVKNRGK